MIDPQDALNELRNGTLARRVSSLASTPPSDPIVAAVCADLAARSAVGQRKYGCTLARDDLTPEQWARHAYEEALDQALYLRRLMDALREPTGLEERGA